MPVSENNKLMIILGIETSCDETASAVLKEEGGKIKILSNVVSSQIKLHAKWGGVVPNLAAREHLKNILPVIETSLKKAKVCPSDLDLISVTEGPGLIPALLVGTNTAKTLSYAWGKPLLGIHHIEGHIYANMLGLGSKKIKFPILCLVVSGGHTQLVLIKKHLDYQIIGQTLDDAAGEAFDKVARILNLGYPGGPIISTEAEKYKNGSHNLKPNGCKLTLPRPMLNSGDYNFSFSGLKTAVLYLVKKNEKLLKNKKFVQNVCYEFQKAVVDVLVSKTIKASLEFKPKTIMIAGGVSANKELRQILEQEIGKNLKKVDYVLPEMQYSIDNASMIACAALYRWKNTNNKTTTKKTWSTLQANANLKI